MKTIKLILSFMFLTPVCLAQSITLPWNIVIYMEASAGHLYQAAFKNLDEIVRNTPDNAHVFAFLHTHGHTGWLYHITKNNMHKIANVTCNPSVAQTLIDVMNIAINKGPAERHGLILWNHGYGILNPVYDEHYNDWSVPYDGPYNVSCSLKRSFNSSHKHHRGICVNNNFTFLSNQDMIHTFDVICNTLLNGKKLAFCGMDLCKGAMFEHAYQLCDYTDYLLGSQECEMVDGWPYDTVLQILQDAPNAPTKDIVVHTVNAFKQYYEQHTEQDTYTLSALDLHHTQKLQHNIDAITKMLTCMMATNKNGHIKNMLKQLRTQCNAFCDAPMYCDLYQWYSLLLDALNECSGIDKNSENIFLLQELLRNGLNLISTMTVARCNGTASTHAHGCSIYFPQFAIDTSYATALFAQESSWVQFLEQFLA